MIRARWSIRISLSLLVAATLVPALVFSGLLLDRYAASERARNSNATETAAARTADAIDRELAGMLATLNALATSPALLSGDLIAFVPQARAVGDRRGRVLVLSDANGRELFRSVGMVRTVTHRNVVTDPSVSDLIEDADLRFATVSVPVRRDGLPSYVLSLELQAPVLEEVLGAQRLPANWTSAMIDSADMVMSRTRDLGFVGGLATEDLRTHATQDRGAWTGSRLDGDTVIAGYARTHLANWRVVVGAPLAAVEQPLRRALMVLTAGGLLLLTASIVLASWFAGQIAGPMNRLAHAGSALNPRERLLPIDTRVREVSLVADALDRASISLNARSDALDAERARLAAIIETVPVGLLIVSPELLVVSGNAQMAEISGEPAGPLHLDFDLRMADGSRIARDAMPMARALKGEVHPELECRLMRPDGSSVWVYMIAAPIHAHGAVTGAVVVALDIEDVVRARDEKARSADMLEIQVAERTRQLEDANHRLRDEIASRAEAEAQLRQAQKMEAVGRLTGGIAHDFNNLLTIVIGSLDLLRRRTDDPRARRLADNAMDGAQRAATLTARLLAFSRQQPLAPRTLDVNRMVDGMSDLLKRTLGEHVDLATVLDPAVWRVHVDPNQLENALINLAVNARDAIVDAATTDSAPGCLMITTSNARLDEAADEDVPAGEYVRLAVSDSGTGMPTDVIARAFEPFFTTKPLGQGTGLGLSQVHGFVKQSGGHVDIASRTQAGADRGTTVTIFLPRQTTELVTVPQAPELPDTVGQGTILLVEDEAPVRHFACEALRELGYSVLESGRARDALVLLDAHPEVRLLFTDMVLPEADGRRLADEARRRRPGLPVLFTTGYTSAAVLGGQSEGELNLITKPYTVRELSAKIAEILGVTT